MGKDEIKCCADCIHLGLKDAQPFCHEWACFQDGLGYCQQYVKKATFFKKASTAENRPAPLSLYSDQQLFDELGRRGYKGTLEKVITIPLEE